LLDECRRSPWGGHIQAIGGVNEKIEGFFDACQAVGFDGHQGVIIPASNVKNLMLRRDVVAAATEGQFAVFPIDSVDQGLELANWDPGKDNPTPTAITRMARSTS